jgi:hypothetical protein
VEAKDNSLARCFYFASVRFRAFRAKRFTARAAVRTLFAKRHRRFSGDANALGVAATLFLKIFCPPLQLAKLIVRDAVGLITSQTPLGKPWLVPLAFGTLCQRGCDVSFELGWRFRHLIHPTA